MPIHKTWKPISPRPISFVVDFYLEKQQDIRAHHDRDTDILHKWTISTKSHPIGVITLDPDSGTEVNPTGTLYGYHQYEDTPNKEPDYPPNFIQLVKNTADFIDYCDKKDILTEIADMDVYSSLRDINGLIRTAYISFNNDMV